MIDVSIRAATESDSETIWEIFRSVIKAGDTLSYPPQMERNQALSHWIGSDFYTYVAEHDGEIVGSYVLKENQVGLGSHVANGSCMVDPGSQGLGVGEKMGLHAIQEAKKLGFLGMQFNFVVATNIAAITLGKKIGFEMVGTIPEAFNHLQDGLTDVHIMYRKL